MSAPAPERKLLPLFAPHTGNRSAMTCKYKCADACAHPVPNTSDNEYFGDIVERNASRRAVLKGGGITAAVVGLTTVAGTQAAAAVEATEAGSAGAVTPKSPFGFTAIEAPHKDVDEVRVPEGFAWSTIISWGDPILAGAPAFDFDNQTAAAQAGQAGYNCDYVTLIRSGSANEAVLAFNNEYTNEELMFANAVVDPATGAVNPASLTDEQLRIAMAAHGLTVVEVTRRDATTPWTYVKGAPRNRRITATTEFELVGPAAGHADLRTAADPSGTTVLGTVNNCAGGTTPWGTVLSGEENFNGYFKALPSASRPAAHARYGITGGGRGWDRIDSRFDLTVEPNEANRFGWVIEVDPEDPASTPKKLTALGRIKHEGAETVLAEDGRVVVYTGDDERFDYAYKFVSRGTYQPGSSAAARAHNKTLLHEGDLYVAKFTGDGAEDGVSDGTGVWLPLVEDGQSRVAGMTVEQVLIYTRVAADKVGPTKMDRPEDFEPNPVNGKVYLALTNNTRRTPAQIDEANPRANNKHGHVLEISPAAGHTSTEFSWKLVLIAGDPNDPATYFNGYDKSEVSSISCPDNVAFDERGNLWISTDGSPGAYGTSDGLFLMPLEGEHTGHLQRFSGMPRGAENCGPLITWDERSVLTAVQHPGEIDGASYASPASLFPFKGDRGPRPSVIQIYPAKPGNDA